MKLAHIAPTSVLKTEVMQHLDFHLCIASQVLEDLRYASYYRNAKGYVILDVPTWEEQSNRSYAAESLLKAVRLIQPSEVVLPDIWGGSGPDSLKAALDVRALLPAHTVRGPLNLMAIPRGHTWEETVQCAVDMANIPGVTTLGVLDSTYEKFDCHRAQVVLDFAERFPYKQLHLLGVQRGLEDIQDKQIRLRVRSADTCKFVRYGLDCKYPTYRNIPDYPGRGEGYFDREVNELQLSYIARTIRYWNNLVR